MGNKWEESGNKNPKVGQEWEQSGNKVGTRTPKWDKNGNKVGTKWEEWDQSGNTNPKVGSRVGTKNQSQSGNKVEIFSQNGNKGLGTSVPKFDNIWEQQCVLHEVLGRTPKFVWEQRTKFKVGKWEQSGN